MFAPLDGRGGKDSGGKMRRMIAHATRTPGRCAVSSCACLGFVLVMAVAVWAGVLWISEQAMTLLLAAR